ncbi:MAG: response regulator transcription factor [Peptoniphilaceae bacterium]|nr:response regulator transcription factor [Peptoniphilaceae bacterium]MDD7382959.1 response regulator transcription factor [Peptoniphilaceae bacterium]MDY3737710.1 response regulator transcription factor [Peptoniphilaceae bacterium]
MSEKTKILIVDDEDYIRQFMKINLEYSGFNVIEAASGEEGVEKCRFENPKIVLLDVMLPGISGFEVCKILRDEFPKLGIIMVTAKSQDIDKIMGLEQGSDDYIIKPFNPQELVLRVKSLERRVLLQSKSSDENILEDGIFKLDLYSKTFYKNGKEIELTPTEFSMLKYFIENKGKAIKRDEIMKVTWGDNYNNDKKIVDVNIRRIRAKIEENSAKPEYLETVWGTGYRWR